PHFRGNQPPLPISTLFPYTTLFRSHPTGRLLGKREPYPLDLDALCRACAGAGCLLELNGHPERMDLPDTLAAAAQRQGVRFVLRSEEHTSELQSRFDLVCRLLLEKK